MNVITKNSFAITASSIGRASNVEIIFGATSPWTDGTRIHLPAVDDETLSPEKREGLLSSLAHECGHIRFTDFGISAPSPLAHEIDNALEDCRIEREMQRVYRGLAQMFERSQAPHCDSLAKKVVNENDFLAAIPLFAISVTESALLGRPAAARLAKACRGVLEAHMAKDAVDKIESIALEVESAASTKDVGDLRNRILSVLKAEGVRQSEEKQSSQNTGDSQESSESEGSEGSEGADSDGAGNQKDEEGSGEGKGSASTSGKEEESADAADVKSSASNSNDDSASGTESQKDDAQEQGRRKSESKGKKGKRGSKDGNQNSSGKGEGKGSSESTASAGNPVIDALNAGEDAFSKRLENGIKRSLPGKSEQKGYNGHLIDLTGQMRPVPFPDTEDYFRAIGRKMLAKASAKAGPLRAALDGLLKGKSLTSHYVTESGRKVSTRHLARLSVGDPRIFERSLVHEKQSAAVHVLLDLSGSMHGDPGCNAIEASLGLLCALEAHKEVSAGLSVFPAVAASTNLSSLACMTVIGHSESLRTDTVARRVSRLIPYGGTPIAEAIKHGELRLLETGKEKKILFVVTDGVFPLTALNYCKSLLKQGFLVFGILIGSKIDVSNKTQFFTGVGALEDTSNLKTTIFQFSRQAMR